MVEFLEREDISNDQKKTFAGQYSTVLWEALNNYQEVFEMNKPADWEEQSKRQGPETTYSKWQRDEGIPIYKNYWADLYALELGPWERKGCLGAFVNLSGQESLDAYVAEIPPGKESKPERHMFEKGIYILSGHGSTTVWYDGMPKHTFEWQEGSLFSPPLNCWHQHFNGRGDAPVRYLAVTTAPLVINLFHSKEFVYENPFMFRDRYRPEKEYFTDTGVMESVPFPDSKSSNQKGRSWWMWKTNFIPDARHFQHLKENTLMYAPGAARSMWFALSENTMAGHIAEQRAGYYKKAHRHAAGPHITILGGKGYSLVWPDGQERVRIDWKPGIMLSPPDNWWHAHFSTGQEPALHMALRWSNAGGYIGVTSNWQRWQENFGEQIEYEDEDPSIRKMFEEECAKNGVELKMPPVIYRG